MLKPSILRADQNERVETEWGRLTWYASGKLGNSQDMTVGTCVLHPGCQNPLHSHPNCEEVLVVVQGSVSHMIGEESDATLEEGDTITIPRGVTHRARNIGDRDAVLFIAFSSAQRETHGE